MFQEDYLAESFNMYLEFALQLIRKHRVLFPHHHKPSVQRLESLLKYFTLLPLFFVVFKFKILPKDYYMILSDRTRLNLRVGKFIYNFMWISGAGVTRFRESDRLWNIYECRAFKCLLRLWRWLKDADDDYNKGLKTRHLWHSFAREPNTRNLIKHKFIVNGSIYGN